MEEEMRTLYIEGVANHDGPESCVGICEGAGEALTGVRAGRAIEPRNVSLVWGADAVSLGGRQHCRPRYRELLADPARSETPGMYGAFTRENREVPYLSARVISGRSAQATSRR